MMATSVTAQWLHTDHDIDWGTSYDRVLATLSGVFAGHHSLALQQTMYAMGENMINEQPEIAEVRFSLPNKHHFVIDLSPFGVENQNEVFHADDRPYGYIEGTDPPRRRIRTRARTRSIPARAGENEQEAAVVGPTGTGRRGKAAPGRWVAWPPPPLKRDPPTHLGLDCGRKVSRMAKSFGRKSRDGDTAAVERHPVDEMLPVGQLFLYGLQHVMSMYAGVVAVPLIVGTALGLAFADLAYLLTAALLVSGLATLLQTLGFWKIGARLPLVQGTSFAAVGVDAGHRQGRRRRRGRPAVHLRRRPRRRGGRLPALRGVQPAAALLPARRHRLGHHRDRHLAAAGGDRWAGGGAAAREDFGSLSNVGPRRRSP